MRAKVGEETAREEEGVRGVEGDGDRMGQGKCTKRRGGHYRALVWANYYHSSGQHSVLLDSTAKLPRNKRKGEL